MVYGVSSMSRVVRRVTWCVDYDSIHPSTLDCSSSLPRWPSTPQPLPHEGPSIGILPTQVPGPSKIARAGACALDAGTSLSTLAQRTPATRTLPAIAGNPGRRGRTRRCSWVWASVSRGRSTCPSRRSTEGRAGRGGGGGDGRVGREGQTRTWSGVAGLIGGAC